MDKAASLDDTDRSLQDTPLQRIWMDECGAFAGTQSTLRDGLGFDERAKFIVGRLGQTHLVVAEQLPLWNRFEVGICLELGPVSERGAFRKATVGIGLPSTMLY